jgi:nucleotide-binding universal stress UspA family protein
MVKLLVCTDRLLTSEALADYLERTVDADDDIYALNSLPGGEGTTAEEVRDGEAAIEVIVDRLDDHPVTIETHQFVRGNSPVEDITAFADEADVDEIVIGIRSRNPVGKVVFGSTSQNLMLETDRPLRAIPLVE